MQTNNKEFRIADAFLTAYIGIFIATNKKMNSISQHPLLMIISIKFPLVQALKRSNRYI